jgi:hypothetical protein
MGGDVVRLSLRLAAARRRAFTPPPTPPPAAPLPALRGGPPWLAGDESGTTVPAAVGLNGEPLYADPPRLPVADMYAVGPGVVWYRQPDEDEDAFRERVRISALAAGLSNVTTWRRRDLPPPWR